MSVYSFRSRASKLIIILLVVVATSNCFLLVESLRKIYRSVEVCLSENEELKFYGKEANCASFCHHQFAHFTYGRNEAHLKQSKRSGGSVTNCCCDFEEPWPSFIQPSLAGLNKRRIKQAQIIEGECLPLSFGFRLGDATRKSYKTICSYLSKPDPLTMLELLDFAQAAAHLNYMDPKHPSIKMTMRRKEMKRLNLEMLDKLTDLIHASFMDSLKHTHSFDGYLLDTYKLREMDSQKKHKLRLGSERIDIVSQAFDEYMSSYVVMDLAAAAARIEEINKKVLFVPEHLLLGHYDKYNVQARNEYFSMDHLNCKLLRETRYKLGSYLSAIKMVLDGLWEKLYYEYMTENYDKLKALLHCQTIYKYLDEVNCRPVGATVANKGPPPG